MTSREQHPEAPIAALRAELEQLTSSFNHAADDSGQLSVEQFKKALDLRSEFIARHLFRQFDADGNGTIERGEFIAAIERLLGGSKADKLDFLFRVHDQDSDGAIEREELDRLIHLGLAESRVTLPEALVDEMVDALFEASDKNGDGRICFDEFSAVFGGYPELLDRVTRANAVWRTLRQSRAPAAQSSLVLSPVRRAANWFEDHGREFLVLVIYALINVVLFVGAVVRYHKIGASPFVQVARGCGACLNLNCALILVPMLRHSLTWLRGRALGRLFPVDHSVAFHKLVGHVIFGFTAAHIGAHLFNYAFMHEPFMWNLFQTKAGLTGVVLFVATGLIWGFALEPVRRAGYFQLFHAVHLLYWVFLAVLLFHGPVFWMWAVFPVLGYLAERLLRIETRANKVEIHTAVLPSRVTKVSFAAPAQWQHQAGDYLFIRIPSIARSEWHPFTISSAPERVGADPALAAASSASGSTASAAPAPGSSLASGDYRRATPEEVTLHVRSLGNWTTALHELARTRHSVDWPPPLEARVDGPYGTPSAHIFNTKYAVLIGAGIGVTPFAAILDSILRRRQAGDCNSKLEKVHFVWINRDQHAFEWFTELLGELERADTDHLLDIHIYMTGGRAHLDAAALQLAREVFYAKTRRDVVTGLAAHTHFGRPDWKVLLKGVLREHAPERVEVFMCGPNGLIRALQPVCRELGMGFHHEVF